MIKTNVGDLNIIYLQEQEFENAELKNQCLLNTHAKFIAYVRTNAVQENELLCAYRDWVGRGGSSAVALCLGKRSGKLEYAEVFDVISAPIVSLLFPVRIIHQSGAFNEKLSAQTNFELLCRIAGQTGECELIGVGKEASDDALPQEDWAETYAYIIRHHMQDLHTLERMDQVFNRFCEYTRSQGIFPDFQRQINYLLNDQKAYERIARQTAPFIVLRGNDTCIGVLQQFADDLCNALENEAQAVVKVDDHFAEHEKIQNMVCKGVIGFQATALEMDFFRHMRGPKFQFWFDYPLHFEKVLRDLPSEYWVLCQDANYAELIKKYYHTSNAIQFPPGGKVQTHSDGERIYDIVFVGSLFDDAIEVLTGEERRFYDYMLAHPRMTFEQGLEDILTQNGENIEDAFFVEKMISLKTAGRKVIGHFRQAVISTILGAGYTLHVYGDDWDNYQGMGREHLVIHPKVTVEESLDELKKAKIGLNIMSWHKAGMTERVANIMLSGAVCLTEETAYLRKHMKDGEEIVCFRLDRLSELPELIGRLLDDPEKRDRIATGGRRKALVEHTWKSRARQLIALAGQEETSLGIFVATHVKCNPPEDPVYIPLHVGKRGKENLGYLGDDTGENISDLNFLYGELTGLFWIWQNISNLDYAGLCHYRRYFLNQQKRAMQEQEYLDLLKQYDAILPRHAECQGTYYQHFAKAHNKHDLDAVGRALKRIYPEYAKAYEKAMGGNIFYWGNLVVTSLPILKAYAEWLFTIFAEASGEIDVSGYDNYHKRVYGFLSEQMFYVFVLANGLSWCEVMVGISEEKAETRVLKERLKRLMDENRIAEARELFDEQLKFRPDLLLAGSDINGELMAIYRQLSGLGQK